MPKVKSDSSFDLQCTLCPKEPEFSDVSHLLTHISSKSHLAAKFHLELRAIKERNIQELLDAHNFWMEQNSIKMLLADRMEQKEGKGKKRSRASTVTKSSNAPAKTETKSKGKSKSKAEQSAKPDEVIAQTPVFRAPVPRMHQWTGERRVLRSTPQSDWEPSAMYTTPTTRRQVPNFSQQDTPNNGRVDPNLTTPYKPADDDDDEQDNVEAGEQLDDSAKLKGILWPGMDLFDAATPEQRRMRNQRKDSTVLEDMIATSKGIEPTEVSYHKDGELRASRDLYGPLSTDVSPERAEIPSPKRRKTRKPTFLDVSTNAPRSRIPRGRKPTDASAAAPSPLKRKMPLQESRHPVYLQNPPTINPLVAFGNRFAINMEDDDDYRPFRDLGKKQAFNVFQDAPEVSPVRTETPLEDSRFEFSLNHGLPAFHNNSTNSNHTLASPTPGPRPTPYRGAGRENGLIESHLHQHSRRSLSDPNPHHGFAMHSMFEISHNPLYQNPSTYTRPFNADAHYGYNEHRSPYTYPGFFGESQHQQQHNPMATRTHDHNMGLNSGIGNIGSLGI